MLLIGKSVYGGVALRSEHLALCFEKRSLYGR